MNGSVGHCETGEYNQINGSNGLHMTMKVTETLKTRFDDHQKIVFWPKTCLELQQECSLNEVMGKALKWKSFVVFV